MGSYYSHPVDTSDSDCIHQLASLILRLPIGASLQLVPINVHHVMSIAANDSHLESSSGSREDKNCYNAHSITTRVNFSIIISISTQWRS